MIPVAKHAACSETVCFASFRDRFGQLQACLINLDFCSKYDLTARPECKIYIVNGKIELTV